MYIPILKARPAEINGYKELSNKVKNEITPLFELIKSKPSKKHPNSLDKPLKNILDACTSGKMFFDLTADEGLTDDEIKKLLDENAGYENWRLFINGTKRSQDIIPVIQISKSASGISGTEITYQTSELLNICDSVAFRAKIGKNAPFDINQLSTLLGHVCAGLNNLDDLIVIIDAQYIIPNTAISHAKNVESYIQKFMNDHNITKFAVAASSFPSYVVNKNYGDESYGHFRIEEVELHSLVSNAFQNIDIKIAYSDYASIHPFYYETKSGIGKPRVDVPLEDSIYYYRRDHGYMQKNGHHAAAIEAVKDLKYNPSTSWGKDKIDEVAMSSQQGGAGKGNPSTWISVRTNIHMTTQAVRTSGITIP